MREKGSEWRGGREERTGARRRLLCGTRVSTKAMREVACGGEGEEFKRPPSGYENVRSREKEDDQTRPREDCFYNAVDVEM
jgi:hypothetical protein